MATGEEFRKLSYPSILRSEIHLSAGKIFISFRDISEINDKDKVRKQTLSRNRLFF